MKKLKKTKDRLRRKRGFSLMETLLAAGIMVLMTLMMSSILNTAIVAYTGVVSNSNADMLLSTTLTVLRDELDSARDISVSEDGSCISYTDSNTGAYGKIYSLSAAPDTVTAAENGEKTQEPGIYMLKYTQTPYPVVTPTDSLHIVYGSVLYSKASGKIIFENIRVIDGADGTVYTSLDEFVIVNH